jgi:hypothetical protein
VSNGLARASLCTYFAKCRIRIRYIAPVSLAVGERRLGQVCNGCAIPEGQLICGSEATAHGRYAHMTTASQEQFSQARAIWANE